jgi:hypothetical protein
VVGGVVGDWRLHESVNDGTAGLLDIPFDSHAVRPDSDDQDVTGEMRLGDFNWLGRWLDTIAGGDD